MSFGQIENNKILMDGQVVGIEFHSREHAKPIYLSPGHRISLTACLKYVKACIKQPHKMPEPLHIAHKLGRKTK
jgi:deoxyribonuclease V